MEFSDYSRSLLIFSSSRSAIEEDLSIGHLLEPFKLANALESLKPRPHQFKVSSQSWFKLRALILLECPPIQQTTVWVDYLTGSSDSFSSMASEAAPVKVDFEYVFSIANMLLFEHFCNRVGNMRHHLCLKNISQGHFAV